MKKATTKLKQIIDTTTIKFGTKFKAETIISFNFSFDSRQNIANPGQYREPHGSKIPSSNQKYYKDRATQSAKQAPPLLPITHNNLQLFGLQYEYVCTIASSKSKLTYLSTQQRQTLRTD